MARKRIKFEVLLSVIVVLMAAGTSGVFVKPMQAPDEGIPSRFGNVVWNHELHARHPEIANCTVCHHQEQQGVMQPRNCHKCHEVQDNNDALIRPDLFMDVEEVEYKGEDGPPPRVSMHGRCMGCHRAMGEGPLGCRDCHAQKFSGSHGLVKWDHTTHARRIVMDPQTGIEGNCAYCHHQDEDALTEADYRACSDCHEPWEVVEAEKQKTDADFDIIATDVKDHEDEQHLRCASCHNTFNPEDDLRHCDDCHEAMAVDNEGIADEDDKERPALEQAVHERCQECHNPYNDDLPAGAPMTCEDCHESDPSWLQVPGVGPVMWSHDRHARFGFDSAPDDEPIDCDTCHHTDLPDEAHAACRRCHEPGVEGKYGNPPLEDALTKRCLGCHEEKDNGLDRWEAISIVKPEQSDEEAEALVERAREFLVTYSGPDGEFTWDLRAHAIDYGLSCRDCHHAVLKRDGEFVTGQRAKKDWTPEAARIQSCRNCHGQDGPVPGSIAEDTEAPSIDELYEKVCIECHVELGGGPQTWDDFFTVERVKRDASEQGEQP